MFDSSYMWMLDRYPREVKEKRATNNIKGNMNDCFKWSVIASLHFVRQNASHVNTYKKLRRNKTFQVWNIQF